MDPSSDLSTRGLPPLPQESGTQPTRSSSSPIPVNNEHVNTPIRTFSQPVVSFSAVSGHAESPTGSPSSWKLPTLLSIDTHPRSATQPATLTPPSALSFDPPPLPYKGLPLSVAEWTFTSSELQDIVSRAIRLSSRESYIRLLSLSTIDETLPQDIARLNTLRLLTQAKYRFQVHRRTMLLQALNSISITGGSRASSPALAVEGDSGDDHDPESQISVVGKLTAQLSEVTTTMDLLAADLVTISTHQSQISALVSTHWGSALAIALRKLNTSYLRRTQELKDAGQRVSMLEAEVAEAWIEADRLASEMDALEKFAESIPITNEPRKLPDLPDDEDEDELPHHLPDLDLTCKSSVRADNEDVTDLYKYADEAVIETANVVSVPQSLRVLSEPNSPLFNTTVSHQPTPSRTQRPQSLTLLPNSLLRKQSMDAISSRSTPSISSRRARINAAKKRSSRASLASLRLPVHSRKGSRTGSSLGHTNTSASHQEKQLPPLPVMSAAVSKALSVPKIQRRRSDQDGGPGASFSSPSFPVKSDGMEIEVVPRSKQDSPISAPLDPQAIPPVWLNSDAPRRSVLKQTASANDATFPKLEEPEPISPTSLSRSASTGTKIRTIIRHGSESVLRRAPFSVNKRAANTESEPVSESEAADEVPRLIFAPNTIPALPDIPARIVTGSKFYESPSICSPGNESPSIPRMQRSSTSPRSPLGSHTSRLARFKTMTRTMTRKYSLALHPFGTKKVETN